MADQPDPEKLAALGKKIEALKAAQSPERAGQNGYADASHGWRMVIGTLPIFLVLFIMFGFAAGLRVMLQTAAEMQKKGEKPEDE